MHTTMRKLAMMTVVVAGSIAGVSACASSGTMENAGGDVALAGGMGTGGMSASAMFADPNVAAVGSASNQEEIQMSRVALERAQDPRVRSYAQRMIDEHTRVESEMTAMLRAKGMAPIDNALSLQMKRNLPPKLDMLRGMTGTQFDMGYMMRQIHAHEMTLLTLDTSLIPETDDAAMKTYLSGTVRPAVAIHLQEAKQLHDQLMMAMHGGGNR